MTINKIKLWLLNYFFNINGTLNLPETLPSCRSSYLLNRDLVIIICIVILNKFLLESHILECSLNYHGRCFHFLYLKQVVLLLLGESENIGHYEHDERYLSGAPDCAHHYYGAPNHRIRKEITIAHWCDRNDHLVDREEDRTIRSVIRAVEEGFNVEKED